MTTHEEKPTSAIYRTLIQIPPGRVATYGQVAKMAGLGRAARFVGTTLKNLPADTKIPWHRVINSQGKISLPDHHPSTEIQKQRLIEEGVVFSGNKINLRQFGWNPTNE